MKRFMMTAAIAAMTFSIYSCSDCNDCDNPAPPASVVVETAEEVQDALNEGVREIVMDEPLTGPEQFTIPNVYAPGTTLKLEIPADGNNVTISQSTARGQSLPTLDLKVDDADDLTINTPNMTVNFDGDVDGTLSAWTADNTLNILAGSTVETLVVNKGNVNIFGTVNAVEKGAGLSSSAKIVQKLGGTLGTVGTGFAAGQIGRLQTFLPGDAGWATDRYEPSSWTSASYQGKSNVFKLTVDATTNPDNRSIAKGNAAYAGEQFNTQGRQIAVVNTGKSVVWEAETKIYVGSDMMSTATPFRVELWMGVKSPTTDAVNAYPILGVANVDEDNEFGTTARTPKWRTYGYTNAESTEDVWGTDHVAVAQGWNTVAIRSTGEDIEYYINDVYAGLLSRTDPVTPYVSYANTIMLQVYNYNSVADNLLAAKGITVPNLTDYSFSGYFADVAITIFE